LDDSFLFRAIGAAGRPSTAAGIIVHRSLIAKAQSSTDATREVRHREVGDRELEPLRSCLTATADGRNPRSFENVEALVRVRRGYVGCRLLVAFHPVGERVARPAFKRG
jgi:hypothetical protein